MQIFQELILWNGEVSLQYQYDLPSLSILNFSNLEISCFRPGEVDCTVNETLAVSVFTFYLLLHFIDTPVELQIFSNLDFFCCYKLRLFRKTMHSCAWY